MPQADHPRTGVRRPPRRWLLGRLALAVVLLVAVVLVAGASDDPELKVINGAAAAGFPLRGDLDGDSDAIRAAADAWLAFDARQVGDSGVLDHDEDMEMRALWAGRLRDTKTVILTGKAHAALVEVESDDTADVQAVVPIRNAEDPRVVVFDQAVLVDTKADPTFLRAVVRGPDVAPRDGLWVTTGADARPSLPAGALVLRGGLLPVTVVGRADAARRRHPLEPVEHLADRRHPAAQARAGDAGLLAPRPTSASSQRRPARSTARTPAATACPTRRSCGSCRTCRCPSSAPPWSSPLNRRRAAIRVLAARGGSLVAGKDAGDPLSLGDDTGEGDNAAYGVEGPPFAAAVIHRAPEAPNRDLSVFVAGNAQIDTIEVLTGRRRLTRPGPAAVFPLPKATGAGAGATRPRGDLAVLGRTRAGTLVVPRAVIGG